MSCCLFKSFVIQILIVVLLFISFDIEANEGVSIRNSINFSFSMIPLEDNNYSFEKVMPGLEFEYSMLMNHFLGLGVYGGYGMYQMYFVEKGDDWIKTVSRGETNSYSYGVSCNLHIFQLLLQKRLKRLDVYATGKVGNLFLNSNEQSGIMPKHGNYLDLSLMLGSTLYLSEKFGVNVQAGYRNFKYNNGFNIKYGFSVRF